MSLYSLVHGENEDDDYDSTYATFYFAIPGEFADAAKLLTAADATPAQRWKSFLNRLENGAKDDPQVKRVTETLAPAFKKLIVRSRSGQ